LKKIILYPLIAIILGIISVSTVSIMFPKANREISVFYGKDAENYTSPPTGEEQLKLSFRSFYALIISFFAALSTYLILRKKA